MEVSAFLGRFPPFDALDQPELDALIPHVQIEYFPAGTVILERSGAPAEHLYVVRAGAVEVIGNGHVIDLLGEGESFGLISLVSGLEPAATIRAHDFTDRWFLEVDLGTESLPTLLKKCGIYEQYRATGIEQEQHGVFPLVLWLFTKQERADRLERAIVRSPRLTSQLYRFAEPDSFVQTMRETLT